MKFDEGPDFKLGKKRHFQSGLAPDTKSDFAESVDVIALGRFKIIFNLQGLLGSLNLPLGNLQLTGGLRFENSVQNVQSFKLFNAGTTRSLLETSDYLPAVSVNYKITPKMQLRANYSETVSRPDLREISNTIWNDVDLGAKFMGNPRLEAARIRNMGLRWEWYFNRGESISLGYFRKKIVNPIEEIFGALSEDGRIVGTTDTQYTFMNIDQALSQGAEFEFRKELGFNFTLGGNYSWIKSEVDISPEKAGQLTTMNRPLQGQSPYLLNLQLDYDDKKRDIICSVLYNSMGERITGVGADGRPDEYQMKLASLDFVASKKFSKNWQIKGKVKNILEPEITRVQGDKVTRLARNGRTFSLGLSGSF